ncbi:MAG: FTR1 family protein [Mariprofundaceae bacterium]|nr:FTR1 family protein [Mariprofundaceae bacterium]
MISALIIVFREMLEMALVLGVLLAATEGMPGTRRWIGMGSLAGAGGAVLIAVFMDELESAATGDGEFLFNAGVLMLASILIAWTVIWMSQHGREMAVRMRHVGQSVAEGELPKTALAMVSLTAVMREGGEAVFFLFGAAQSVQDDGFSVLLGGLLGVVFGALAGYVVYKGLAHIPLKHLFGIIGWLLILLAAGMASQAVQNLVLIDVLPALMDPIWDSSGWLSQSSFIGELLHVMIGYTDQPSGMQMLIFLLALIVIASVNRYVQARHQRQRSHVPA